MEETKAHKIRQLLDKNGLNAKIKQSIKDKVKAIKDNETVKK